MGRRDSLSASKAATNNIPAPNSTVPTLVGMFQNVGLDIKDLVALSGNLIIPSHTSFFIYTNIGQKFVNIFQTPSAS